MFNYLLFRCEKEEQVEHGTDAYDVPNFGKFVYCGLKGIEIVIRKIQETNDLGHPLCGNLREGTWLATYIINRLRRIDELKQLADLVESSLQSLNTMPHFLRPCYFELVFSYIYNAIEEVLIQKLGYVSYCYSILHCPYNSYYCLAPCRNCRTMSKLSSHSDCCQCHLFLLSKMHYSHRLPRKRISLQIHHH